MMRLSRRVFSSEFCKLIASSFECLRQGLNLRPFVLSLRAYLWDFQSHSFLYGCPGAAFFFKTREKCRSIFLGQGKLFPIFLWRKGMPYETNALPLSYRGTYLLCQLNLKS